MIAGLTLVFRIIVAGLVIALAFRVWQVRKTNGPILYAFGQRETLIAITMGWYIVSAIVDVAGYPTLGAMIREWAWIAWGMLAVGMVRLWRALGR